MAITGALLGLINYDFIDLHFSFIRNPLLFYSSSILTTLGLLILGNNVKAKIIEWFGRYSLIIMFCQIIQDLLCRIINKIYCVNVISTIETKYMFCFITLIISMTLSALVVKLIIKYEYLGLIISPRRKIKNA